MRRGSIRGKIVGVIATAAVAAVVLTGATILICDAVVFRSAVVREHATLARMVAFHSAASLAFDDPDHARSILEGLAVEEHVLEAVLDRDDGSTLARYRRNGAVPAPWAGPLVDGHRIEGSLLFLVQPVTRDGERLGALRLVASLEEIAARRRSQLVGVFTVLLVSSVLVLRLASRLSHVIADPILGLAEAADRIGKGDLTTRVVGDRDDELGALGAAFNEMAAKLSATTVSKDYLDDVLESMNDALIVADAEGRIERVNRAGLELLRWEENALAGRRVAALFAEASDMLEEARRKGTVEDRECLLLGRGGSIPASVSIALMGGGASPDATFVLVARDIRERKQAERALQRSEARFRCLVEQAADALVVFDPSGTITEVNHRTCEALGYIRHELLGASLGRIVPGIDLEERRAAWSRLAPGAATTSERLLRKRDGGELPVEVRLSAVEIGGERSYFALARDITERKEQERALIEAREAALEASRLKSQFLANVSHEMRTPMNGIIGMTDIALETDLSPEQRGYLETVRSSSDSLLRLIDDVLDLIGIEAGRLQLETVEFSPGECAYRAARQLALDAHQKGLELLVDVAPEVPAVAIGDGFRIQQVLTHLLSNAIKFTESGEVVARVHAARTGGSRARFVFAVEDTGIGIPESKRKEIFGVFAQVDGSMTRRAGGAGLGLAVSSKLLDAMGAQLSLSSEPGRGSTFEFELTLALPDRQRAGADDLPTELQGLSALVVDDNTSSRAILERLLSRWGATVCGAASADEALALSAEWSSGSTGFDVVLVDDDFVGGADCDLPRSLGSAGARAFLRLASPGKRQPRPSAIPVVSKPVEPQALLAALRRQLASGDPGGASRPASEPERKLHVLVAEDNPVNCAVVVKILERRGHEVASVANGREAVGQARDETFDVILMDIQMPVMDGIEASRAIRAWEAASGSRRTPIVAVTAHAMKGDRERCLEAGMDEYVSKPVTPSVLLCAIERAPSRSGPEVSPAKCFERGPLPVLNLEALLERIGNDRSLLSEIVRLYFDETPDLVHRLEAGLSRASADDSRRAAHRLRGMLATMGAERSAAVAERLEAELEASNLTAASSRLEALVGALRELESVLFELWTPAGSSRTEVTA